MESKSYNKSTPKIVGIIVISAFVLIILYTLIIEKSEHNVSQQASEPNTELQSEGTMNSTAQSTTTDEATTSNSSQNTAGNQGATPKTYTASSAYSVPRGNSNSVNVALLIDANGTIASVDVSHKYTDQESAFYVNRFNDGVENAVVGKNIRALSLGRIGGASLTTNAFEEALSKIANERA